eukprot:8377970-Pyramimonas_sp.AAC.1
MPSRRPKRRSPGGLEEANIIEFHELLIDFTVCFFSALRRLKSSPRSPQVGPKSLQDEPVTPQEDSK